MPKTLHWFGAAYDYCLVRQRITTTAPNSAQARLKLADKAASLGWTYDGNVHFSHSTKNN